MDKQKPWDRKPTRAVQERLDKIAENKAKRAQAMKDHWAWKKLQIEKRNLRLATETRAFYDKMKQKARTEATRKSIVQCMECDGWMHYSQPFCSWCNTAV